MEWLWIILRYLFPTDPVRQCIAAARHSVAQLANDLMQEDVLLAFAHDQEARRNVACAIQVYEHLVRTAIAARACQIAGLPFGQRLERPYIPPRAKDLIELLARLGDLARMCHDIERLAQLHAVKLMRLQAADPFGLAAHGSTDAWLRHAAHHEGVSVAGHGAGVFSLILSSTRSVRPSKDEDERPQARMRDPPIFDVFANQPTRLAGPTCEVAPRCATALAFRPNPTYQDALHAGVAELVDALVLGTSGAIRGGSSPSTRTSHP